jgi:hypothetical protein
MKKLILNIEISQTDILKHSSTNIFLNKKTGKLNYGFVKGVYDYNQQVDLTLDGKIIFSTKNADLQPSKSLLIEVVRQFNNQ